MTKIAERKKDHLDLCATNDVDFKSKTTLLEQVQLVHRALPELALADIDLAVEFCGKKLLAPLWVSAITGGTDEAVTFNREMAEIAEKKGLGFCLGSIKPLLRDPSRRGDYVVRDIAPSALVMANIGGTELVKVGHEPVVEAIRGVEADGLTVHLNPAMELVQPGGDTDFKGVLRALGDLVDAAPELPIVVKETGCGVSYLDGAALKSVGIDKVEVGGAGGTSWVGVETQRAEGRQKRLGELLWDWGIPTAPATDWLATQGFQVVAAGGIRTGLDVAAALALGARLAGIAAPLVRSHRAGGKRAVEELVDFILEGLRVTMLLCGVKRPGDLAGVPRIIGPDLARWLAAGPSAS